MPAGNQTPSTQQRGTAPTGSRLSRGMRTPRPILLVGALASGWLLACTDPVDKAAKQRVFSAEDPPKAKLAATEPIDATKLASDPSLAHRVLTMGPGEAFERIGAHRFTANVSFTWKDGKRQIRLNEERVLEQAGADEFALSQENDRDQGLEVVRTGSRTYSRSKYLKFRERLRDRGQAEKLREDTFTALRSASNILGGRLAVAPDGEGTISGRAASRYKFVLAASPLVPPTPSELPPIEYPAGGPDPDTQRRIDFEEKRVPKSVKGTLWVDKETGVPLQSELAAVVSAPGNEGAEVTLELRMKTALKVLGDTLVIKPPEDFLPDEDKPDGVAAALKRFEIEKPEPEQER